MPLTRDHPIELVEQGYAVDAVLDALTPELWNQHRLRTADEGPHREVDDIWARCLDWDVMRDSPATFNQPHVSSWYTDNEVIRNAALDVCDAADGDELGGVLITRIPSGCQVYPHIDQGWHARYYEKYALQLKAHPDQAFCFERQSLVTQAGDLFTFDNSFTHWVTNESPVERITMIVCIKRGGH